MKTLLFGAAVAVGFSLMTNATAQLPEPKFRAVTIDDKIQIGYGLAIADVDGDGLKDILLADKKQFVWYRNPGAESSEATAWKKFILAENLTVQDNVCIAAQDIDGDGKCEVAVGAGWNPSDTENSGAVFYLIAPADRTQRWEPVKLHAEPTTHRMRWIKVARVSDVPGERSGALRYALVVVPLHGRENKNGEGAGVKVLLYYPPGQVNDPRGEWKTELIDDSMHMTHNFHVGNGGGFEASAEQLLLGGREGVHYKSRLRDEWVTGHHSVGPAGVGEVREGNLPSNSRFVATVEPMHGNTLAVSTFEKAVNAVHRVVITDKLIEGHALACDDLLGVKSDQIVVGWRGSKPEKKAGIALWAALDERGEQWRETAIDDGGMACEDLQLADLNGDGKLDIIASGRATKNVKIYFNETR
jgi:hypothetical protein